MKFGQVNTKQDSTLLKLRALSSREVVLMLWKHRMSRCSSAVLMRDTLVMANSMARNCQTKDKCILAPRRNAPVRSMQLWNRTKVQSSPYTVEIKDEKRTVMTVHVNGLLAFPPLQVKAHSEHIEGD